MRALSKHVSERQIRFTVITIVLNDRVHIEETLKSVVSQTYTNYEYLVIDGKSCDGTVEIIQKYSDKITTFVSEKDAGIYDAMNKGINLANGEWIIFMNSGDKFYHKDVLKQVNKVISNIAEQRKNLCGLYGDSFFQYVCGYRKLVRGKPVKEIWKGMVFSHQSLFINSLIAKKYKFNVKNKYFGDYELIFKLHMLGYNFHYIPLVISITEPYGFSNKNKNKFKIMLKQYVFVNNQMKELKVTIFYLTKLYMIVLKQIIHFVLDERLECLVMRTMGKIHL